MIWKEVKSWAIKNGYNVTRSTIETASHKYEYTWNKDNEFGKEYSTLGLVKVIYNDITENKYSEHQKNYMPSDIEIKPQ